ncbi:hypothetical protein TELCIR_02034 [Teladorsagia circumcincta]|uniref:SCP domain-containing protein n=1 Tax=Teladorsagia circumcincta TaxID=45464 RepID=A0A2G9V0A5_TELCI|nr:hypothetical protein TELCIR_02034 [Teladorsagia circumcincta]
MAWATTKYLGCAVSQNCGDMWYAACHYSPGGNIVNRRVYEIGKPCSNCPVGFFCDSTLLCEANTRF